MHADTSESGSLAGRLLRREAARGWRAPLAAGILARVGGAPSVPSQQRRTPQPETRPDTPSPATPGS